jgi:hypothetical protein
VATRFFSTLAAGDLGCFELFLALDLAGAHFLLGGDALGVNCFGLRDAGLLDGLVCGDAGRVDGLVALDFEALGCFIRRDPRGGDLLLASDACGFNGLGRLQSRRFHRLLRAISSSRTRWSSAMRASDTSAA